MNRFNPLAKVLRSENSPACLPLKTLGAILSGHSQLNGVYFLQKQQRELAGQLLTGVVGLVLLLHGYLLLQQSFRPWSTKLLAHFYGGPCPLLLVHT